MIMINAAVCIYRIAGNFRKVKFSERFVQMYWVKIFGGLIFGRSVLSEKLFTAFPQILLSGEELDCFREPTSQQANIAVMEV